MYLRNVGHRLFTISQTELNGKTMCQLQATAFFTERGNALFHVTYGANAERTNMTWVIYVLSGEYTDVPNIMSNVLCVFSQKWQNCIYNDSDFRWHYCRDPLVFDRLLASLYA